jgi:hypothetical protein
MNMTKITRHDLTLGGIDLSGHKLTAVDLSHVNQGFKKVKVKPVLGVLGADILLHHEVVIDYARNLLLLSV